ncbi:Origin recognition complex subunit 2 [Trichoplax sp. H2]|nr:Origin recognition complex subunit 2 [Trichoplax sp. H2]|eukprot:RDD40637.1 Origin recognition complex subunit 2 [Trichoplax sp. H2]
MAKVDLSITFLGDDNVVDHIVNIAVGNDKQNKTTSTRTSKPIIIEPSDDHDGATGAYQRCSKTEATEGGRQLYQYKRRNKRGKLARLDEDTKKFPSQKRGALKPISNQVHENSVEENGSDVSVDEDTNNIDDNGSDLEAESSTTTSSKKLDMNKLRMDFFDRYHSKMKTSSNIIEILRQNDNYNIKDEDTIDNCAEYAKNQRARCLLYKIYRKKFNWWMSELWEGFNLLFYGLGSKRTLLEQFRAVLLQSYPHLVVNGYFPNMSIKNILNSITQDILKFEASFRSPIDQCNYITNSLNESSQHLFIIIHNIDSTTLKREAVQTMLSYLAQCSTIHIIASIDQLNAPLLWDQAHLSRFNWIYHDVTTFEPYIDEIPYESSLTGRHDNYITISSLMHVFESLTPNAKKIFRLIGKYQLDNINTGSYLGIPFQECYIKCRENFLVNSESTLKAHLTEFFDHKMIKSRKGPLGVEHLSIPIDTTLLSDFMDDYNV